MSGHFVSKGDVASETFSFGNCDTLADRCRASRTYVRGVNVDRRKGIKSSQSGDILLGNNCIVNCTYVVKK